jgi:hypothetical protein
MSGLRPGQTGDTILDPFLFPQLQTGGPAHD